MFTVYPILLLISGVLLIVLGAAIPGQTSTQRVLNLLFGVAFFGYGFYLEFLFQGGTYFVFYYAFIVPILMIVRTVQARKAAAQQTAARQAAYQQQAAAYQANQGANGMLNGPQSGPAAPSAQSES
jgi:hypothetical protein